MKEIKFIKDFSSPIYGNVWNGRIAKVKPTEAEKQIARKNAIYADSEITESKDKKDGDNKSKRGKRASKGGSE